MISDEVPEQFVEQKKLWDNGNQTLTQIGDKIVVELMAIIQDGPPMFVGTYWEGIYKGQDGGGYYHGTNKIGEKQTLISNNEQIRIIK